MTPIEIMSDTIMRACDILKMTVGDFSDADMLVRPAPGANHAAWQLAHLTGASAGLVGMVAAGVIPDAAAQLAAKYTGKTADVDDPAFFPGKAELLETFAQAYGAMAQWVKTLSDDDLNRPMPERVAGFAPTVGHLLTMTVAHIAMHVGQFQVIRRTLGKPRLF